MLVTSITRSNHKVGATPTVVTLESALGSNLPLLFPNVSVICRTSSVTVALVRKVSFVNQADPDFNGTEMTTLTSLSLSASFSADLSGLWNAIGNSKQGVTHELTITKTGVDPEALVSVVVSGMIESSINGDPNLVVNV